MSYTAEIRPRNGISYRDPDSSRRVCSGKVENFFRRWQWTDVLGIEPERGRLHATAKAMQTLHQELQHICSECRAQGQIII